MGYGVPQVGQWTPMDSPSCPMVQLDRTDSGIRGPSGGTVDSHGQSHLSHGTVGSHRILMADLDITPAAYGSYHVYSLKVIHPLSH